MYKRLLKIDSLTLKDHYFLEPEDRCYYLGEFTARGGYGVSDTNQLIANFKKKMDRRGRPEWKYKGRAIRTVAEDLRRILQQGDRIKRATFVPIPPSKARDDPLYDDRGIRTLNHMAGDIDVDVREIVYQAESMEESHTQDQRASIDELIDNYRINDGLADPPRDNNIILFDDLLTTGRHFRAMEAVLLGRFPQARIHGIFIARRMPKTIDVEELFGEL